jgi:hypothetical protein
MQHLPTQIGLLILSLLEGVARRLTYGMKLFFVCIGLMLTVLSEEYIEYIECKQGYVAHTQSL